MRVANRPKTPIVVVTEGSEPALFTMHFRGWDYDKPPAFEDPSRPLVVDAGCGFGALAAALAKARPHVNVLAVDRAAHCLLYGAGLAHRLAVGGEPCGLLRGLQPHRQLRHPLLGA